MQRISLPHDIRVYIEAWAEELIGVEAKHRAYESYELSWKAAAQAMNLYLQTHRGLQNLNDVRAIAPTCLGTSSTFDVLLEHQAPSTAQASFGLRELCAAGKCGAAGFSPILTPIGDVEVVGLLGCRAYSKKTSASASRRIPSCVAIFLVSSSTITRP